MSTSKVLNRWLNRCYKVLAILLVLVAVLISSARLFFPYADNYRGQIQSYINEQYNTNVVIGGLSLDWQSTGISLVGEKVGLLDSAGIAVSVDRIHIGINIWQTLLSQTLVTERFNIHGAKVFVDSELFNQQENTGDNETFDQLIDILLNQINKIVIDNSQLIFQQADIKHQFLIEHLFWLNRSDKHQISGDISLANLADSRMLLRADLKGYSRDELSGLVYVNADKLNIAPWLTTLTFADQDSLTSSINFDAWLTVQQGSARRLQLLLKENSLQWLQKDQEQMISLSTGQLVIEQQDNFKRFVTYSSPLTITTNEQSSQPFYFKVNHYNNKLLAYLSLVDLNNLSTAAALFLKPEVSEEIIALNPQGRASDIYLEKDKYLELSANFSEVSSLNNDAIPGVENLSGQIILLDKQAHIELQANNGAVDFGRHFPRPIPYQHFSAMLDVTFEQGFQLQARQLDWQSPEVDLTADVSVDIPEQGDASMALYVLTGSADVTLAQYYYPHLLMGQDLVDYLNESIIDGKLEQAQVIFNGKFKDFPFTEHSGVFTANAELDTATFKFDSEWPSIEKLSANLDFTNNSMLITARSGLLTGLPVRGVTAAIDDLTDEQVLDVSAAFTQTNPANVRQLMLGSPLSSSVGEVLNRVAVQDEVSGNFKLLLPLNDVDKVIAQGQVNLIDNSVELATPEMSFTKVNGRVFFKNDKVHTEQLALDWRGLPLELQVNTQDKQDLYQTDIAIQANWQELQWQSQIPKELQAYVKGVFDWQGQLSLFIPHQGDFSYQMSLETNLAKAELLLPEPYYKALDNTQLLAINVDGHHDYSDITATLGKQLNFRGELAHDKAQFSRAHLVLGQDTMMLPMDGFHITAQLNQANLSQWQPLISDIIAAVVPEGLSDSEKQAFHQTSLLQAPERIRGRINQLLVADQSFTDVSFNLLDKQEWWLLQLNAKQARSQIKLYPNILEQGIDAHFDFLQLYTPDDEQQPEQLKQVYSPEQVAQAFTENSTIFSDIPPIRFSCDGCRIDKLNLGKVIFDLKRAEQNTLALTNFSAERNGFQINLSGDWQHDSVSISQTHLTGNIAVKSVEYELEQLGFASVVKDSGAKFDLDLTWQGGPQDFHFSSLNGDFSGQLDDGYLADVSDKGARLFSVLSLQSLVRKLTLDFRDIFSDGMFYTKINSDFVIKDGVMYTDNTEMKGVAGDLIVKGNTNLTTDSLDYNLSYKPNLTSSLPVLAWIATLNPVTFLAGMAIDEVITSKVVSEFNFQLTGTIKEPDLKEVNRKTRDVTVGRSTPPELGDQKPKNKIKPKASEGMQQGNNQSGS